MQRLEIRGKPVGLDAPVFIIGEAGSNHNGRLETAHELIDVAARAGVDAVKFQTFRAERLYPRSAGTSDYLGSETPIFDIIRSLEMPEEWLGELRDHAWSSDLAFLSTPFHVEAVDLLDRYVDAFKVASYELTHDPLLEAVAARGKPVILSTGAVELSEVRHAVGVLNEKDCVGLVLLQCTAAYPTPLESANVRALVTLRETLDVLSGLSDHTRDPTAAPMAATALGAAVIEKHFTLSNRMTGPDHAYALEPEELKRMVGAVRRVEAVLGDGVKRVQPVEEELRHFAQRSIFTTRDVQRGDRFDTGNVDVLRHGKRERGLPPKELARVMASRAARDLEAETPLTGADLAE